MLLRHARDGGIGEEPKIILVALGIAWLALIVGETVNADAGLGYLINNAREFLRTDVIVVGLVVYAVLGLVTDALVRLSERRALRWRKGWRNVVLGLRGRGNDRALAEKALAEVRLADLADAWPRTLSGGEAQRLNLARALVREPDLLLLDERFGALDRRTGSLRVCGRCLSCNPLRGYI